MDLIRQFDIADQLSRVDVPTPVSVGSLDPVTPVPASEEIVPGLPRRMGRLHLVEGACHFTWMDAPDRYWPMFLDFMDAST